MMAMGVTYQEFWSLNPRKIRVIAEGYRLSRKVKDEESWLLGGYVFEAVSVAIGNALKKRGQKAKSYFEVVKEPVLSQVVTDDSGMTEHEKKKKTELLFKNLEIMAANFNLQKGKA